MRTEPVDSSVILSVGYDRRRSVLKVRFRNGRSYYYLAVPAAVHQALMASPSMGRYLNEVIKPTYRAVAERDVLRAERRR